MLNHSNPPFFNRRRKMFYFVLLAGIAFINAASAETWRGLAIAPE